MHFLTAGYHKRIGRIASRDAVQGAQGNSVFVPALKYSDLATATGTEIDFSSPFSNPIRVVVGLNGLSLDGANDDLVVQLGDSGGVETSGYTGIVGRNAGDTAYDGDGFQLNEQKSAGNVLTGQVFLDLVDPSNFTWMASYVLADTGNTRTFKGAGVTNLDGACTTIRVGRDTGGNDSLDAGTVRIAWYGY